MVNPSATLYFSYMCCLKQLNSTYRNCVTGIMFSCTCFYIAGDVYSSKRSKVALAFHDKMCTALQGAW